MGINGVVRPRTARVAMLLAAAGMLLAAPGTYPQTGAKPDAAPTGSAPAQLPAFEVASIKPHAEEGMMMRAGIRLTPDGVSISGVPLHMLLHQAFGVPDDRIAGEPNWTRSDRYDIEAKVDAADAPRVEKLTPQERWEMLLPVLEDRCALRFHHETKDLQVYELVVAKGGPKLTAANPDSSVPKGAIPGLGRTLMSTSPQGMRIEGHGASTAQIASVIQQQLGSTVVDKTGLKGTYDYTLSFAPELGAGGMMDLPPGAPPPGAGGAPPEPQGPSLFSAVQEQLGLKLEAHKEPVDVIVIDHILPPSAN